MNRQIERIAVAEALSRRAAAALREALDQIMGADNDREIDPDRVAALVELAALHLSRALVSANDATGPAAAEAPPPRCKCPIPGPGLFCECQIVRLGRDSAEQCRCACHDQPTPPAPPTVQP